METWVCAGWVLASNGDMGACWLDAGQQWKRGCVPAGNRDMGACCMGVGHQWRHWCLLGACWPAREAWARAGWGLNSTGIMGELWRHGSLLVGCWTAVATWALVGRVVNSNGNMGVCWLGAGQQWRHGCVQGMPILFKRQREGIRKYRDNSHALA